MPPPPHFLSSPRQKVRVLCREQRAQAIHPRLHSRLELDLMLVESRRVSPERLQEASTYPEWGERESLGRNGTLSPPCPQDAVGLEESGSYSQPGWHGRLGPQDPLPSRERLRSASVGGRLNCSAARKRVVGFMVCKRPRELGGSPDLPTYSIHFLSSTEGASARFPP